MTIIVFCMSRHVRERVRVCEGMRPRALSVLAESRFDAVKLLVCFAVATPIRGH